MHQRIKIKLPYRASHLLPASECCCNRPVFDCIRWMIVLDQPDELI